MIHKTSRKTFLKGAIGLVAGAALIQPGGAGATNAAGVKNSPLANECRDPRNTCATALGNPDSASQIRVRGVNHVLKFEDRLPEDEGSVWAAMWRAWDWENWIEPQLNDIAKVGNTVRFWGNTLVLALGNITLDKYLDQWKQVLDHTSSIGLLLYPCGGDLLHWGDFSQQKSVECYSELAGLLKGYPHVIGMDIANEAVAFPWNQRNNPKPILYNQPEPYDEFLGTLGEAVRDKGIPVSYSRNLWSAPQWAQECSLDSKGDFLDFHVYYTPDPSDSLPVYETQWGRDKKMLIGEFGIGTDVSPTERDEYYTAIKKMAMTDTNCIGAIAWSGYDPFTTPKWQTGLFDRRRAPREDILNPFLEFPSFE